MAVWEAELLVTIALREQNRLVAFHFTPKSPQIVCLCSERATHLGI